jgi:hypothetical protein
MGAVETAALPGALCYVRGDSSNLGSVGPLGRNGGAARCPLQPDQRAHARPRNDRVETAALPGRPCYSRARACAMPRRHLGGIGLDLMLACLAPDDDADVVRRRIAERHRRPRLGPHRRRRPARGGAYVFGDGSGSRTGGGMILSRIACRVRMRGGSGKWSAPVVRFSSSARARLSASVRASALTCRSGG